MKPVVMKDGACGDCRVCPWDSYFTCLSFSFLTHEARMRTPVLEGHWEVKNTQTLLISFSMSHTLKSPL